MRAAPFLMLLLLASDALAASASKPAASPPPPPAPPPPAPPPPPPPDDKLKFKERPRSQQHGAAITLGGGLAATLMVEATGEINLPDQHAVAVIVGIGSPQAIGQPFWGQLQVEAGAQYRYAFKGDFNTNLWVGAEGVALFRPLQLGVPWDVAISPLLGFKYTAPFGLVADVSAGPSLVVASYRTVRPAATINLQIGWAFGKAPKH